MPVVIDTIFPDKLKKQIEDAVFEGLGRPHVWHGLPDSAIEQIRTAVVFRNFVEVRRHCGLLHPPTSEICEICGGDISWLSAVKVELEVCP